MIVIKNVEENPKTSGPHEYEIRINRKLICRFVHNREESLAVCLEKAAKACLKHELMMWFGLYGDDE